MHTSHHRTARTASRSTRRASTAALLLALVCVALTSRFEAPVRAAVALTAVAPLGASAGVSVQITGTGFDPVASNNTVTLTPQGGGTVSLAAETIAVLDAAKGLRRIGITVPAGLPVGAAAVMVRNRTTNESAGGRTLQVVTISLPQTSSAARGATGVQVRVDGSSNVQFVAGRTTPTFGAGITVTSTQVLSPTSLLATVSVSPTTSLGPRTLNIVTSTQAMRLVNGFTVGDANRSPTITSTAVTGASEGTPYAYQVVATDPDGDAVTFRLVSAPAGMTIAAGLVTWTPASGQAGTQSVVVEAMDGRGGTAQQSFQITVAAAPQLQAIDVQPPLVRLSPPGASQALTVTGLFTNGTTIDLTASATGTTYESSDPAVALASANGSILAIASGSAVVTVRNGSLSDTVAVVVTAANTAPVADAGPDQTVFVATDVTLDGSASRDVDGDALTYRWSLTTVPAGSTAQLAGETGVRPTFRVDIRGVYVARLIVNDGTTDGAPDTITVSTQNSPPVADAGPDQTAPVLTTVTLDGSASRDVDGDALTYQWTLFERPATSTASLVGDTLVRPTFVVDAPGTYVVRLIVNDGSGDSAPDTIAINTSNSPPVADAGPDQTVLVGAQVTLDGTASRDVDGHELSYFWTLTVRPVGSAAAIDGLGVRRTLLADVAGTYVAQLVVNDGQADSTPDTVVITTQNSAPIANAGLDQTVLVGATVQLDAQASSDADRDALTSRWALTSRPAGSAAALDDPNSPAPRFVADLAGTYVAQLIVNDGTVDSAPDLVTISTENSRPVANAGTDQQVAVGTVVQLDGRTSSDADGHVLTFRWSFTARPTGSTAAFSDPASAQPSFTVDRPGTYVAQLIVNDGQMDSGPDTVTISTANSRPVANAGPDRGKYRNNTIQLDGRESYDPDGTLLSYAWSIVSSTSGVFPQLTNPTRATPDLYTFDVGQVVVQLIVSDGELFSEPDTVVISAMEGVDLRPRAAAAVLATGQRVNLNMVIDNWGNQVANHVEVRVSVPSGYTLHGITPLGGSSRSYDPATGVVTFYDLPGFAFVILDVTPLVTGSYDFVVEATLVGQQDIYPPDNTLRVTLAPSDNADLGLSVPFSGPLQTMSPGASRGFATRLNNNGPADARNIRVRLTAPSGYTVTAMESGGVYNPATGVVEWTIGSLRYGNYVDLRATLRVNATGPTDVSVSVTADNPDSNPANNVVTGTPINRPPAFPPIGNRTVGTYESVALTVVATDAEADPLTYQWVWLERPFGSTAVLAQVSSATATFTTDLPGVYVARVTVSDGRGGVTTADVTVTGEIRNRPPVIRSAPVTIGAVGAAYRYPVFATDPDTGDVLTFSLPVAPAGMTVNAASGVIDWLPGAAQAGPQPVTLQVRDAAGRVATQAFSVQVSSTTNPAPVAADDAYEVRLGEALSVPAAGVLQNDTDASPLFASLVSPATNGTVTLNADGSFTYVPHTQRSGELLVTGLINLANRLPGVVARGGQSAASAVDENPATVNAPNYSGNNESFVVELPIDATVHEIQQEVPLGGASGGGRLLMFDAAGAQLYASGFVGLQSTSTIHRLTFPGGLAGVRTVQWVMDRAGVFKEFRVIGTVPTFRSAQVEPDLAQRLPVTVRASNSNGPESVVDGTYATAWYASSEHPSEFIEIAFPADVTVSAVRGDHHRGVGGFNSSLGYSCSGVFSLRSADGTVLFDSGVVNHPSSAPNNNIVAPNPFDIAVPNVSGVRVVRYQLSGCAAGGFFNPGFTEIQVIGTSSIDASAFRTARRLQSLTNHEVHSTPIVINLTDDNADGRIDANDIPDIVVPVEGQNYQLAGEIKAISGDDGRELFTAGAPLLVSPWSELAAGDIDGDGLPEIVAVHADGQHLIAFEHTGALKWVSDQAPMPTFQDGTFVTGAVSLANLDGAGPPEIVVGATVFDANGRLLGRGAALGGTIGGAGKRSAISAVGDIDLDGTPELVAGPTAYRLINGALTRVWGRTDRPDGYIALGNFDDDPQAEIVVVSDGAVYLLNHDGTDAEVWNPSSSHAAVPLPGGGQGGAPLVADVDGDGRPEIGVAGSRFLTMFNRDGSVRWQRAVSDLTSNATGSVAFDLDGDGAIEIIYRDEYFLRIYRGADGLQLARMPVGSATWSETPTVADVDNDGHADIVVSSDQYQQSPAFDRGVIVFNDFANLWTRTRRIWNQHAYHVTNVNEDGTIPLVESPHWLVSGLNGFRTNRFVPGESPDTTDAFTYVASDGVLQSNVATAHISVRPVNGAPNVTSSPGVSAARGVTYAYPARATDPDGGDILTWSLPTAPAGMTVDAASGLVRWTPEAAQTGAHAVVVKVQDLRGLFALQSYTVEVGDPVTVPNVVGQSQAAAQAAITAATLAVGAVSTRNSPTVPSGSVISQSPAGGTLAATGSAVGLVVSTGPAPAGTVPDVVGQTQTNAAADIVAAQFVVGAVTPYYTATVPQGVVIAQTPAAGATADLGTAIAIGVSAGPPPGTLDVDGDGYTGDRGDCNDTNAAINPGAFDVPGDGIDQNCNGVDSVAGDATLPTALLVTPADLAEVTMPTDIVGTVADVNFLRYTVQLAEVDATSFTTIGSGSSPVSNGIVGRLDPTLLENGLYRVRLIAEDVNGLTAVDERVYRVDGQMKVGVQGMSFVDLRVPVTGIAVTVVRSYDSRVKESRDFGVGWDLQVRSGKYQNNRPPGEGWTVERMSGPWGLPCTAVNEVLPHATEVRLSDREVFRFRPRLAGMAPVVGGCVGTVEFDFVDGNMPSATLEVVGNSQVIYTSGGQVTEFDGGDDTGLVFDPRRVRLTTPDGRAVDFERGVGITRLGDPNGNVLTITSGGIAHSSGKSIAMQRDAAGRIARITDPNGAALSYEYSGDDLAAVIDQLGNRTTFEYDARHNLLAIRDPLGNRAFQSEYDAEGRLTAMVDARGNRIEFSHQIDARSELIVNALGHVTRVVYDDRGFVTAQENQVTIEGAIRTARATFVNDRHGNQTVAVDADGVRTESVYHHDRDVEHVLDPAGLRLRTIHAHDARGELLSKTDAAGNEIAFDYDGRGNLTRFVDPVGSAWQLTYDQSGRGTSGVDPAGVRTLLTYDASGRVVQEERQDSSGVPLTRASFTYDASGNRLSTTELRTVEGVQRTLTTRFEYDSRNRLVATVDPSGGVSRTEYNAIGRESARIDSLGRRTSHVYDETGSLVRTEFADGTSEQNVYDALGNITRSIDRAGRTTTNTYDELGRVVRVQYPDGVTTQTVYSPGGRVVATIDSAGQRTDYEYDSVGRRVRTVLPETFDVSTGVVRRADVRQEYDGLGRVTAITDAYGRRTTNVYGGIDRLTRMEFADGTTRSYAYDALGRRREKVDEAGQVTRFAYDALGRLVSVTPPIGGSTTYTYDEAGNQLSETDALGRSTRYTYDALGRRVSRQLPGGEIERTTYDGVGNVSATTDFNGTTTTFTYDVTNRLIRKTFADDTSVSFVYTATGQRAAVVDERGTTRYEYDDGDKLTRVSTPAGSIEYEYDTAGRLSMLAAPGGVQMYTYDARNRPSSVSSIEGTISYGYDAIGNVARLSYPNGVVSSLVFDVRNRVSRVLHRGNGVTLASFDYNYSPTGRRTSVTDVDGSQEGYEYDALDRLVAETRVGTGPRTVRHTYDAVGNRTRSERDGVTVSYTYDVNDRLLTAGAWTLGYDANGNVTSRTSNGATTTFGWDSEGRLTSATGVAGVTRYEYDADGNQVRRQAPGSDVRLLVDPRNLTGYPQVIEERDNSGALQASYTYGIDLLAMSRAGAPRFYLKDALGSTRRLTDAAGVVTDAYAYDGYGSVAQRSGVTSHPYLFAGERFDEDLGMYNLRARHYDPITGRFVSRDPAAARLDDPRTAHPYLYAHADPVNLIDPTGRSTLIDMGIAAGVEKVLQGLEGAARAGQACGFIGKAKAVGTGIFFAAAAAAVVWAKEEYYDKAWSHMPFVGGHFEGKFAPAASVELFGFENKGVGPGGDSGFKQFTWSLSLRRGGNVEHLFDLLWLHKSGAGGSGRVTFDMKTGNLNVTGGLGYMIKGPTFEACGVKVLTTNVLALAAASTGTGRSPRASLRLLGQMSFLGLIGMNHKLLEIP